MRPSGFDRTLGELPDGVETRTSARGRLDVVVFFATSRAALARRFDPLAAGDLPGRRPVDRVAEARLGSRDGLDRGRGARDSRWQRGLVDNKVCAIDDTWSGLRLVYRVADRGR